jgi:hypothetical protein
MAIWPIGWTPPRYYDSSQALALRRRDKGKPAAKRGRKAYGPPRTRWWEVAGLSNGDGGGGEEGLGREEATLSDR